VRIAIIDSQKLQRALPSSALRHPCRKNNRTKIWQSCKTHSKAKSKVTRKKNAKAKVLPVYSVTSSKRKRIKIQTNRLKSQSANPLQVLAGQVRLAVFKDHKLLL
jgi:hypothetical protein